MLITFAGLAAQYVKGRGVDNEASHLVACEKGVLEHDTMKGYLHYCPPC